MDSVSARLLAADPLGREPFGVPRKRVTKAPALALGLSAYLTFPVSNGLGTEGSLFHLDRVIQWRTARSSRTKARSESPREAGNMVPKSGAPGGLGGCDATQVGSCQAQN